jgi:hypothetical protein
VIVAAEERVHLVELHRLQVGNLADRRPVIGVIRRKERRQQRHRRQAVGAVFIILPPLVEHDLTLVRELRLGQRRQQITHSIRFHPQRELERAGRHHFPIVGAVGVGRSVERRTGALQRLEIPAVVVLRALEHQVLEQVREAGLPGPLVLRADVIPQVHRHDRTGVVLVQQDLEPVRQRVFREGDLHRKLPQVSICEP